MTTEQIAYYATLNLLGTGFTPVSVDDAPLMLTLEDLRFRALASAMPPGPKVRCTYCSQPFAYDGPTDGEHFAELWEHLIVVHHRQIPSADGLARMAWHNPQFPPAVAA
ncbi:hypothetical protein [Streptomyces sp. NPDC001781]